MPPTRRVLANSVSDGAGESVLPIAIPADPTLAGAGLWMQSIAVDVGGELLGLA